MELTKKQEEGLRIAIERYKNKEKYTIISGFAGTGKSTLVSFIISALKQYGVTEEEVVFTSFTGKATQVLQKKGNKNVSTLHKLLYDFFPKKEGGFIRKPKPNLEPYKVVVVDECSMVPKELLQTLAKHKIYIICLGDPGQLPPINKNDDNHLLDNPHIFLDEVMRQAAKSEIIQLSMKIRNGEPIDYMKGKEVQVIKKSELSTGMLLWADQVLCAKNATRIALNKQIRQLLNKGQDPEDGDKVICLRNYWDEISENEAALVNGTIGYLRETFEDTLKLPAYISGGRIDHVDLVNSDFVTDIGDEYYSIPMDKKMIQEGESSLTWQESFKMSKNETLKEFIPFEFTYGYAITGWKAQGSEWDKVLIIEENFPFDEETHKKFLYTCVTRGAKKVVLVRNE